MPPEQLLPSAASAEGGDRAEAGEVLMVRRSAVAACVTCGLCGGILRDPTTVSKCLHSCELLVRFLSVHHPSRAQSVSRCVEMGGAPLICACVCFFVFCFNFRTRRCPFSCHKQKCSRLACNSSIFVVHLDICCWGGGAHLLIK
jgi:hypothetical protein